MRSSRSSSRGRSRRCSSITASSANQLRTWAERSPGCGAFRRRAATTYSEPRTTRLPERRSVGAGKRGQPPMATDLLSGLPRLARRGEVVAYNLTILSGLVLSALGMYALARRLGCTPLVAGWAGLVFMLFPWHIWRVNVGHASLVHLEALPHPLHRTSRLDAAADTCGVRLSSVWRRQSPGSSPGTGVRWR